MHWLLQTFGFVLFFPAISVHAKRDTLTPSGRQRDGGTFQNPASRDRPRFRYWLPDASVDADVLKEDIKSAGEIGAGGVEFVPFFNYGGELGGPPSGVSWAEYGFGSPSYIELLRAALEAHDENSLAMDFALGPNQGQGVPAWPGNEGLQWDLTSFVTLVPVDGNFNETIPGWRKGKLVAVVSALVLSSKNITHTVTGVTGPVEVTYEQMVLRDGTLIDITDVVDLSTGRLSTTFQRPCGTSRYRVFAFYENQTGAKNLHFESNSSATSIWDHGSFSVDHFSARGAQVTTDFWNEYLLVGGLKEWLSRVGNFGWEDSLEIKSNVSWSPTLPGRFFKKFGYDLKPYLPLIMFGNNNVNLQTDFPGSMQALLDHGDRGTGFVNDFRAALSEGYLEYLQTLQSWLNNTLGLKLSVQPSYNMPMDMLAIVPYVDAPESESLQAHNNVDAYRHFAGPSNLAGSKIISNELGAVFGRAFSFAIPELLQMANRGFSGGINQFVIHGQSYSGDYAQTTWPGHVAFRYWASDLYSSKRPDWEHGLGQALDYMGRVQTVQRQGFARTDVAIYEKLSITDPNFATVYPWYDLVDGGWSYNYLSPDNFKLNQVVVRHGILAPGGPEYRAMIVLSTQNLTLEAVESMQAYAQKGLPIIIAGGTPGYYPTNRTSDKNAVEKGISDLLESHNVHQVAEAGVSDKLFDLGLKPRAGVRTNGTWLTTWREDSEAGIDFAFVFSDIAFSSGELVIQSTKTPYVFDAWTGERSALLHYTVRDGASIIPLSLAGNQTAIFAFSNHPFDGIPVPKEHITELSSNVIGYGIDKNGSYVHVANASSPAKAKLSSGREIVLPITAPAAFDLSDWKLIAEHWEAPEDMAQASIVAVKRNTTHTLDALVSWSEIPELVNASGVGYYVATFNWPYESAHESKGAYMRFPPAANAIILEVNGQRTAPMDPTDPVADISSLLKKGENELVAIVPSTMWNYVRSIIDDIENGGLPPIFAAIGSMPPPTENGLVGTASILPFEKVHV